MKFLDLTGIRQAFAEHMIKHRDYTEEEAAIVVSDFPDTYNNCYLEEHFVDDCEIDGIAYEKYACNTCFWVIGLDEVPMFRFYIYYRAEDVEEHTIGDYMQARKLYQTDELDLNDFPEDFVEI